MEPKRRAPAAVRARRPCAPCACAHTARVLVLQASETNVILEAEKVPETAPLKTESWVLQGQAPPLPHSPRSAPAAYALAGTREAQVAELRGRVSFPWLSSAHTVRGFCPDPACCDATLGVATRGRSGDHRTRPGRLTPACASQHVFCDAFEPPERAVPVFHLPGTPDAFLSFALLITFAYRSCCPILTSHFRHGITRCHGCSESWVRTSLPHLSMMIPMLQRGPFCRHQHCPQNPPFWILSERRRALPRVDAGPSSQELRAAGLPCDFPPNRLKQGHGEVGPPSLPFLDGSRQVLLLSLHSAALISPL